jgi:hypothetical protein
VELDNGDNVVTAERWYQPTKLKILPTEDFLAAVEAGPAEGEFYTLSKAGAKNDLKLTRFCGHRTVCVQGVHDGQDKIALRS